MKLFSFHVSDFYWPNYLLIVAKIFKSVGRQTTAPHAARHGPFSYQGVSYSIGASTLTLTLTLTLSITEVPISTLLRNIAYEMLGYEKVRIQNVGSSSYYPARLRAVGLIENNAMPLRQTTTCMLCTDSRGVFREGG